MIALSLLGVGLAWATGVALVTACLDAPRSWPGRLLGAVGGLGIGCGIHSLTFLAWRLLSEHVGASAWLLVAVDAATLTGAVLLRQACRRRGGAPIEAETSRPPAPGRPLRAALLSAVIAAGALAAVASAGRLYLTPYGDWDAWAMWNLKAEFLARAGYDGTPPDAWRGLFSPPGQVGHRDYPLLLPATVARLWVYIGRQPPLVPQALAWACVPATLLLLVALLAILRDASQGALAALALAATPLFSDRAGTQYADSPLGFYELLAVGLVALLLRRGEGSARAWLLAGAALGCAAWTKNEGHVFASVALIATLAALVVSRDRRSSPARAGALLLGLAPFVCAIIFVKTHAPPNADAGALLRSPVGEVVLAPGAHRRVWRVLADLTGPALSWPLLGGIGVYALLAGIERRVGLGRACAIGLIALCSVPAVFYVFYLAVPQSVPPAITFDRVLAQAWPGVLLVIFALLRSPDELLARRDVRSSRAQ